LKNTQLKDEIMLMSSDVIVAVVGVVAVLVLSISVHGWLSRRRDFQNYVASEEFVYQLDVPRICLDCGFRPNDDSQVCPRCGGAYRVDS